MLTKEVLLEHKDNFKKLIGDVSDQDISTLTGWLEEKDDQVRHASLLLLQELSGKDDRVYRHWDVFKGFLNHENSYQRSIGIMLLAENVKWDGEGKFGAVASKYLKHTNDEKFITSRQCIQALNKIVVCTDKYNSEILDSLLRIELTGMKDTQKGLLLLDITDVLGKIMNDENSKRIDNYLRRQYENGNKNAKEAIKKLIKI